MKKNILFVLFFLLGNLLFAQKNYIGLSYAQSMSPTNIVGTDLIVFNTIGLPFEIGGKKKWSYIGSLIFQQSRKFENMEFFFSSNSSLTTSTSVNKTISIGFENSALYHVRKYNDGFFFGIGYGARTLNTKLISGARANSDPLSFSNFSWIDKKISAISVTVGTNDKLSNSIKFTLFSSLHIALNEGAIAPVEWRLGTSIMFANLK